MSRTIAIAGKGGVGKTTISALTVQWLMARGETPVLAVDADSNANLHEALGVGYTSTVGGIREDARETAKALTGVSKQEFLDMQVQEALVEQQGYDLIVMGRPEGPGCYCFANNVLRDVIQRLSSNYCSVVVDSEAGLEHLSRRTLLEVDLLLIVSDCTVRGIHTARRVAELAAEMNTPIRSLGLVVNRVPSLQIADCRLQIGGSPADAELMELLPAGVRNAVEETGLPLLGVVPADESVAAQDAGGLAVADIPADAPARVAVNALLARGLGAT